MNIVQPEQLRHDRVNLVRLVKKLEQTIGSTQWQEEISQPTQATWIKTQGMLQKLKYARKLLKTVELYHALEEDASSTSTRYEDYEYTIDKLESTVAEAHKRATPRPRRPAPILPTLPLPVASVPPPITVESSLSESTDSPTDNSSTGVAPPELLLSPSQTTIAPQDPAASLLPASPLAAIEKQASVSAGTPAFLQNSAALQEDLSEQLALMAAQLKRNAIHFASSLEKDKAAVQDAQEKIEHNYDVMTKERVRLRDHRSKSWGTTWLVVLSLVVVVIGFLLSFFVIRLT